MRQFKKLNLAERFRPDTKPEKLDKPKKKYSFKKKPTGEKPLFEEIWQERGPYSQISGVFLGEISPSFFAHILPKGQNKYPKFKLHKPNIILMSFDEHHAFDNNRSSIINLPQWKWIIELEAKLKEDYKKL